MWKNADRQALLLTSWQSTFAWPVRVGHDSVMHIQCLDLLLLQINKKFAWTVKKASGKDREKLRKRRNAHRWNLEVNKYEIC